MLKSSKRVRIRWALRVVPCIAAVWLAGGVCGHATAEDAPPQPSGDACALLSAAQVSAALGVDVNAGVPVLPTTNALCSWNDPSGPLIGGKKLTLSLMNAKVYADGKNPSSGIVKSTVRGVGDDAYSLMSTGFGASLSVKKGDTYIQLRVHGFRVDKAQDIEKALALQLVPTLPR